jgi:hypothetical protein
MAQRTREQLNTANAALFVNNETGDITPALEKAFNEDVNDSAVNIKGDTFAADAEFAFQNNSKLREGAIAHGFGGGIARVCANEKADQWEDGFRYLIETVGSTNTVVYAETINNIIPDDTYDETDSWAVGSRLKNLVTGIEYLCTQANEGDAIWIPLSGDWVPTITVDGAGITAANLVSANISYTGNIGICSLLFDNIVSDFGTSNEGFVQIAGTEFPISPIGGHIVSGQFYQPVLVGIKASSSTNLRINLNDPTGTVDLSGNELSIVCQFQV